MHPLFQVTIYTGQQLVLEAIQRWLARPCAELEAQRQRRNSLRGLISLLVKTAATGVLATVLDAAVEYRRRQLVLAVAEGPSGSAEGAGGYGLGGVLSRSGIAAWKTRLLVCIDEMERHAEAYGIEPTNRFTRAQPEGADKGKGPAALSLSRHASTADLSDEERQARLACTVEQLRDLVKQGDPEAERRLDDEVGSFVDMLLGPASPHSVPSSRASAAGSRASLVEAESAGAVAGELLDSPSSSSLGCSEGGRCQICMDRQVKVEVVGCRHDLCFQCARRLCASQDHAMPACPFCRQTINGFAARPMQPSTSA